MFDFSQMVSIPKNDPVLKLSAYNEQIQTVSANTSGVFGALYFNRYMMINVINNQINAFYQAMKEQGLSDDDIAPTISILDTVYDNYLMTWDSHFQPTIGLSDMNVLNGDDDKLARYSQIIGVAAYVSMSLFVDLLLGVKRYHIDAFGVIDDRFEKEVLDKGVPTKSLFVTHLLPLIRTNLFSAKDFALEGAEQSLIQSISDAALERFDEATLFYAKETQWKNILSDLQLDIIPLSQIQEQE